MEKRWVISFTDGEEIIEGLNQAAQETDVHFARFIESTGDIKTFDIISDNYDRPEANDFLYRLDKVSGTVMKSPQGPKVKLHCTLVKKGVSKAALITGQLRKAVASGDVTIILTTTDMSSIIQ